MTTDSRGSSSLKRHRVLVAWAALAAFLLTAAPQLFAQTQLRPFPRRPEAAPDRYIVQLRAGLDPVGHAQRLSQQHGLGIGQVYRTALQGFSAMIPPGRLAQIQNDPAVLMVEPDRIVRAVAQTVPTGIERIGAPLNSLVPVNGVTTSLDVDVAVIDTGVDETHPDLSVFRRTDCVDWDLFVIFLGLPATCVDGQGTDGNSHGTHVSGTIGALDNGIGVVGVAPGVRIWSVRVLEADGSGYLSWLVGGMDYVAAHASEIEVANMSLGWIGNSPAARTAVQNAVNQGVVFMVAAGNDGGDIFGADGIFGTGDDAEPAAYPEVATISALVDTDGMAGGLGPGTGVGPDDTLATFSTRSASAVLNNPVNSPGAGIDLAAPGVDILSTLPGGTYGNGTGTSMATPHATGAAALYIAAHGRAFNAAGVYAIRQALIDAAQQQGLWGPANTGDTDGNREGLAWVAAGTGPPVNPPPVITINNPTNGAKFASGANITFSGTASDEGTNLTNSMTWSSSKQGVIGSGGSFVKKLNDGIHTITASATDSLGKTGSSSVVITVGCVPTSVTVTSVTYSLSRTKKDLSAIVTLKDNCNKPVVGASVTVYMMNLTRGLIWEGTGPTNQQGSETFLLRAAPSGLYQTQVMDLVATGLTWDGNTPTNSYNKK